MKEQFRKGEISQDSTGVSRELVKTEDQLKSYEQQLNGHRNSEFDQKREIGQEARGLGRN